MNFRTLFIRPLRERELGLTTFLRRGAEIVIADHPSSDLFGLADRQIPVPSPPEAFRNGGMAEIEERVVAFARRFPLTAVTADFDYLLPLVGRLNDRLGLRGHTGASGTVCASKVRQRAALDAAGVPSPGWRPFTTRAELSAAARELGFPLVVKPGDRSNSAAVRYVAREAELDGAYAAAVEQSWTGEYLVEQYLDGPEVSVEAITFRGCTEVIAVTDKEIGQPPRFLKLGAEVPSRLPSDVLDGVREVAVAAVAALGVTDSPSHTELRITAEGPKVVEVNARVGGLFLAQMVQAATGVNLYDAWFDVVHGRPPRLAPTRSAVAVRRCVSDGAGEVAAVDVGTQPVEEAERHVLTRCHVKPGAVLKPAEDNFDVRAVHVAAAPTREEAVAAAERLVGTLGIRVRELQW
ncbi:ATP-grasp domain-containing protein [Amycolatopsis sacchari]|uniref:ATP-grasp domain-containing protein n=1 Tax=Amycolatopsis sacchari TaxID=115433 RepID=UPI003EBDC703